MQRDDGTVVDNRLIAKIGRVPRRETGGQEGTHLEQVNGQVFKIKRAQDMRGEVGLGTIEKLHAERLEAKDRIEEREREGVSGDIQQAQNV